MRIFGFAGWSGSGKTTLIERLVPILTARAGKVSLVKHAHHGFDVDQPGKDSFRHREAGCREVLVSSSRRYALMHELRGEPEPTLPELVARLSPCDLVLVEGFKAFALPKLEVWRPSLGKPLLYRGDPAVRGIATDDLAALADAPLPVFSLDGADEIATFVLREAGVLAVVD
ncbi:MAG: molybdopterin-guanine dinucleotide biosynthesis protein B [Burkholderiales bacterium]|nr:molybdopterin-guanine dinucleotide biosynthesis protein B [Burkholderiales bacterium]